MLNGHLFSGYLRAGPSLALLWRRDSSGTAVALMALELRSGAPRYNFIGGKRDDRRARVPQSSCRGLRVSILCHDAR